MNSNSFKKGIPYILIALASLFMYQGIFKNGLMSGYDNSFHYYDVHYLVNTLIPQYHWIGGWSIQNLAGFPVMIDYYQVGHLIVAFFNKALFMPLDLSYKMIVLLSYMAMGIGFYRVLSSRFGKAGALLVALCFMLQKDVYNDRILEGMWSNYLAIGMLFVFFDMLDRNIVSLTVKKVVALGLLLGLIILTHLYVAIFGFMLLFIYFFPYARNVIKNKSGLGKLFLYSFIPIASFLISAYYLYGFVVSREYFADIATKDLMTGITWSLKSFFSPLEKGPTIFTTLVINIPIFIRILFGFLGVYLFFKEKDTNIKRFLGVVLSFVIISLVLFSDVLANLFSWWGNVPFVGDLQTNRFLIYIQIGMYIFAVYGISKFLAAVTRKKIEITLLSILIAVSLVGHYVYFAKYTTRTLSQSDQMQDIKEIWSWVNENVPEKTGRIVYQSTIGNTKDSILNRSDVFALSGVFTNVAQIGVARSASPFPQERYMRNDHGRIFGKSVKKASIPYIGNMMYRFNAPYIVTVEPLLRDKLGRSYLFLHQKKIGNFDIFKVRDFTETWIGFKEKAGYSTKLIDNQNLIFEITNSANNNEAVIKFAYHPLWRAHLNGKITSITYDKYGMIVLALPEAGRYILDLKFHPVNHLWVVVSLLSFIVAIVIVLRKKVD